jgi:hypothetical protein
VFLSGFIHVLLQCCRNACIPDLKKLIIKAVRASLLLLNFDFTCDASCSISFSKTMIGYCRGDLQFRYKCKRHERVNFTDPDNWLQLHFFERFYFFSGPRGTRQKNLQILDSMNQHKNQ